MQITPITPLAHATRWVWPLSTGRGINRYLEIHHSFELDGVGADAALQITADARYAVWINGVLIGTGPFADWPQTRSVDSWHVTDHLRPGRNALAMTIYEIGAETASYANAPPGVAYALVVDGKPILASGDGGAVRWRLSPAFRSGEMPRLTGQLPFTFEYNAMRDDGWTEPDYIPAADWTLFTPADGCELADTGRHFRARPLPAPVVGGRLSATVVAQGLFKRTDRSLGVAAGMQRDWLSSRTASELFENVNVAPLPLGDAPLVIRPGLMSGADGAYFVIDLGREAVGYVEFEFTADAGTLSEFSFGEHLDDLRVRSRVGGRNFASSLRAKAGRQTFLYPFTRIGARYLQLHVSNAPGDFTLHYAGLRELSYEIEQRGRFDSPDQLQNRIHATAVDTLRQCMFDHYDDCPWREQGLYANDMLNQSLAGYYAFGDYRFPQVSLELLAGGLGDDGVLELCAPARIPITIPAFTMAWIMALELNLRFSGDTAFARRMFPHVKRILTLWLERATTGLLPSLRGPRYWHFYDWTTGGLDGTVAGDCTRFFELTQERFDAPLNAFFILGLTAAAAAAENIGETRAAVEWRGHAQRLRGAFHTTFWDDQSGLYATFVGHRAEETSAAAELSQALALCAECTPDPSIARRLRHRLLLKPNGLIPATLSQSLYKFEALLQDTTLVSAVMEKISQDWGGMLFNGATTFWETLKGGWDFDGAGSRCHGWSATPAYFYGAYLLGIRPLQPGFTSFSITAPAALGCDGLTGVVPTPHGNITVKWERADQSSLVYLTHPPGTRYLCSRNVYVAHAEDRSDSALSHGYQALSPSAS